ncbi:MAG: type I secretion system permease/ATPase [Rhizobiales bacterium PAR1]|nr:MAG: type I secretion system permease/ATPase [Rhizobiales bacterium PAR1]
MNDTAPSSVEAHPTSSLLAALLFVARHHGRPVSGEALLAGLPIEDGILRPALFQRAAARADLVAEPFQRSLVDIPPLVLPAILLLRDGRAVVLIENDPASETASISAPTGAESRTITIPRDTLAAAYSGYTFFLKPSVGLAARGGLNQPSSGHWFWTVLSLFKANYLYIAAAAFLINLLALAFPFFTMNVYDRVLPNGAIASLIALSIGVLLAFAFDLALRLVRSRMIDITGKQIDITLAAKLFAQVMGIRMEFRPRSAGVLANQIRDFEGVREFFTSGTVIAATDLLFAFVFLGLMFGIVGPLALVPLFLLPIAIAIGFLIQRPLDRAVRDVQAESAARHGILVESIGALETIRAIGAEGRVQTHWERSVAASTRASEAVHRWSTLSLTLSLAAQNLASLLIIIWGVFMVLNAQITMGALVAANMLSGRILAPVANIASVMMRGSRTLHALKAIDALMRLPVERPAEKTFVERKVEKGALRFDDVTFRYPEAATDALSHVTFSIKPGERIGIVGRIGSGKTTVGRLAMGFYAPQSGAIHVDGVDIRQYDPADLRQGFGFVLQDNQLFHGTLRDNITMGRPTATDAEMIEAARIAGVEDFASVSPLGYDMPVAEGGRSLSGGQRQAVALARALIRRPKILFLDEPTSALDMRSEADFVARLEKLDRSATLIFSTHRVSLLGVVDRVIVFDQGKIVADGPREDVLAALQNRPRKSGGQT